MLFKTRKLKKIEAEVEEPETKNPETAESKEPETEESAAKHFSELMKQFPMMVELTYSDPEKPDMLPIFCHHVVTLPVIMHGEVPEIFVISADANGNKLHAQMQFAMMSLWVRELSLDEELSPVLRSLCEVFWEGILSETMSAYGVNTVADSSLN